MTADPANPVRENSSGRLRALPALAFLLIAGLFGYALMTSDPSKLPSALIGRPAPVTVFPPLEGLVDAAGKPDAGFSSADLTRGTPSVVNFWASWCAPCTEEHPHLVALAKEKGVTLYGVNYKDTAENARRFLGRYGNPFTAVGTDSAGRGAIEWGVYGMPETFVVDGAGRIVYKHVGPITAESLADRVLPAIEKARAASP